MVKLLVPIQLVTVKACPNTGSHFHPFLLYLIRGQNLVYKKLYNVILFPLSTNLTTGGNFSLHVTSNIDEMLSLPASSEVNRLASNHCGPGSIPGVGM